MVLKNGIIFLLKDRLQVYSPFLKSVVELRFTPEMVRDLDVIDEEKLAQQIKVFVTNGKLAPVNFIIVLSDNAYFVKDFVLPNQAAQSQKPGQPSVAVPKVTLADLKPQIDLFIEHIPYENVVSKTFPLKNGSRVCAVNQDLYASVERAFEQLGFSVSAVFLGMVLGGGLSSKPIMDMNLVNTTLQKYQSLKQYDLKTQIPFTAAPSKDSEGDSIDEVQEELSKEPPKTNKKRLIGMIGLLVVLLVVLVVVYMQSMQPPPPPQPTLAQNQPTVMPQISPSLVPPTASPAVKIEDLTVQITNTSSSASAAQSLKKAIETTGTKDVTVQTKTGVTSSSTIVSFSDTVDQSIRTIILDEVKKFKTTVTVQEQTESTNDITIILGK